MSPDIIALQYENTLLRLLLEHANEQNSELLEMLRKTTAMLAKTTASLESSTSRTETLLAKTGLLMAQHEELIGLIFQREREATGGTLQ